MLTSNNNVHYKCQSTITSSTFSGDSIAAAAMIFLSYSLCPLVHTFQNCVKIEAPNQTYGNWMLGRIVVGIVFHVLLITLTRASFQQLPQLLDEFYFLVQSLFRPRKISTAQVNARRHNVAMCSVCTMWLKSVECERYRSNGKTEQKEDRREAKPFKSSNTSNFFLVRYFKRSARFRK